MADPLNDFSMPDFQMSGTPVTKRVETPLLSGSVQELECDEDNSVLRIEGDIVVREAPAIGLTGRVWNAITFGHGVADDSFLWPGGVIPYVVHGDVDALLQRAIDHWHAKTPLRFEARAGDFDYVSFEPGPISQSPVGRQGDKQTAWLVRGTTVGWAIHEPGHVVGVWHEHGRHEDHLKNRRATARAPSGPQRRRLSRVS